MVFYKIRSVASDLGYRGIHRLEPLAEDLKNEDFIDEWSKYIMKDIEETATYEYLVTILKILKNPLNFEIIKVVENPDQNIERENGFLGYDITDISRHDSFFSYDWNRAGGPSWESSTSSTILVRTIFDLFECKLNENRLLPDIVTAKNFQKSVTALCKLCPGTFESPEAEVFTIFGVVLT